MAENVDFPCPRCGNAGTNAWLTPGDVFALLQATRGPNQSVVVNQNTCLLVTVAFCSQCGFGTMYHATPDDLPGGEVMKA